MPAPRAAVSGRPSSVRMPRTTVTPSRGRLGRAGPLDAAARLEGGRGAAEPVDHGGGSEFRLLGEGAAVEPGQTGQGEGEKQEMRGRGMVGLVLGWRHRAKSRLIGR